VTPPGSFNTDVVGIAVELGKTWELTVQKTLRFQGNDEVAHDAAWFAALNGGEVWRRATPPPTCDRCPSYLAGGNAVAAAGLENARDAIR